MEEDDVERLPDAVDESEYPDDTSVIGSGEYWLWCPSCAKDAMHDTHIHLFETRYDAWVSARGHRRDFSDHRPVARGPDGDRIYG